MLSIGKTSTPKPPFPCYRAARRPPVLGGRSRPFVIPVLCLAEHAPLSRASTPVRVRCGAGDSVQATRATQGRGKWGCLVRSETASRQLHSS